MGKQDDKRRLAEVEAEIDGLKRRLSKHASAHTKSLTLLFEKEVQKLELEKLNFELEQANRVAYKVGMADISREIIHNIGNVMNSALTSISSTHSMLSRLTRSNQLDKAGQLLENKVQTINDHLFEDKESKRLLKFYRKAGNVYMSILESAQQNTARAISNIDKISAIISALGEYIETPKQMLYAHNLTKIANDVLIMNSVLLSEHEIVVQKEFADVPPVTTQGLRVVQILNTLIGNAVEAMRNTPQDERLLTVSVFPNDETVVIEIKDNGCGFSADDLEDVFAHDFRLKGKGYGTSLHYCANYVAIINGEIYANSDGPQKGTTVGVKIPLTA